jgi:hypothetical protein
MDLVVRQTRSKISIRGSDLPGFPVQDDLATHGINLSEVHLLSPAAVNSFRLSYFRHKFFFDERLNKTSPRDLGFNYDSASSAGQGVPFFNINGYSPVGGSIVGPRTSVQNDFEMSDSLSLVRGAHAFKLGGDARATRIAAFQAIAPKRNASLEMSVRNLQPDNVGVPILGG